MDASLTPSDWASLVAQCPELGQMPFSLQTGARLRVAEQGDVLFREGGRPQAMLFVISGELRLVRVSREGAEIVLQRSNAGFIAEATHESPQYRGDIVAAAATCYVAFPLDVFEATLRVDPLFRQSWIDRLAGEVRKLREQCERLGLRGAGNRIVHFIESEGTQGAIRLKQSRAAWAGQLGLTREALHRALARLTSQGAIEVDGRVIRLAR